MVIDAENSEMHQVRDFIAANWSLFTSHIREKSMTDEQAEEEAQRILLLSEGKSKGICLAQGIQPGAGYARYFQVCPLICQPDSPRYKRNIMADTKRPSSPLTQAQIYVLRRGIGTTCKF